jgi:hypothetical protein
MDFYVILGVDRTASAIDVKRAYRRLARKHHPDINPGDQEAEAFFRLVSEAYETLIDPDRRQEYDVHGQVRTRPDGAADPLVEFEGFDFSVSSTGESASTFGDLFADVFANSVGDRAQETAAQGVDLHTALRMDFQDAVMPVAGPAGGGWLRAAASAARVLARPGGPAGTWCFPVAADSVVGPAVAGTVPAVPAVPRASCHAPRRSSSEWRPESPMARASVCPARAAPGGAAARPAIST